MKTRLANIPVGAVREPPLLWLGLVAALSLVASCVSGDEAPAGGRIEHPEPRTPVPVTSTQDAAPPPEKTRPTLDPAIFKALVNDCPRRPWSQNVPDRDCSNDDECGDGFCDRGHCATIWTCLTNYGYPCNVVGACMGLCIEGRCRSCQSDEECAKRSNISNPQCNREGGRDGERVCTGGTPPTLNRPIQAPR
jgi:hypothetical protein